MNPFKILISTLVVITSLPEVFGNAVPCTDHSGAMYLCDLFKKNTSRVSQIEETFSITNGIGGFELQHDSSVIRILVYDKNEGILLYLSFDKVDCPNLSFNKIYSDRGRSSEELFFTFYNGTWYPYFKCWSEEDSRIKQNCIDAQRAADATSNKILELRRKLLQTQKRTAEAKLAFGFYTSAVVVLVSILLFLDRQICQMYQEHQQQAGQEQEHQQQAGQEQEHQQQAGPDQEQQDQGNPGGQAIPDGNIYD